MFLIACDSVEEQQARLEHARADYRQQQHRIRTAEAKEKLATWLGSLDSVSYAEFYRTDETLGPVVPSVEEVKITGKELEELLAIFRRAYPVPLPDADILTNPGSEPLRINNDGEVEEDLFPLPEEPVLPDRFFAICVCVKGCFSSLLTFSSFKTNRINCFFDCILLSSYNQYNTAIVPKNALIYFNTKLFIFQEQKEATSRAASI
jgi:hypothetical protein